MNKLFFTSMKRGLAAVVLALAGSVHLMAVTAYAPFGQFSRQPWQAKYYTAFLSDPGPADNWFAPDFDDASWSSIEGPISIAEQVADWPPLSYFVTKWENNFSSYWVRRHFTVSSLDEDCYLFYAIHDNTCTAYLNGEQIYTSDNYLTAPNYNSVTVSADKLHAGDNVLAVRVTDTGGNMAFMDFGLYGYDIDDVIGGFNENSNVTIEGSNDASNPWKPILISNVLAMENGNQGKAYSTSDMKLTYQATRRQEVTFDWLCYRYSNHPALRFFVDGADYSSVSNNTWEGRRFYLDAGTHILLFRDTIGNSTDTRNVSQVGNLRVREILPLETAVLTKNSQPLTFQNDGEWPWTIEENTNGTQYIRNTNYEHAGTASTFSTTFTIDKISKLSFYSYTYNADPQYNVNSYSNYHQFRCTINGKTYFSEGYKSSTEKYVLEPGTYTVEWRDSIWYYDWKFLTEVRDIELSSNWIDVSLAQAGTLGVEVLYQADVLKDVELLKVAGPLNNEDWKTIRQMTNLLAIDLSEAQIDALPSSAFSGLSQLQSVQLPEGLTSIGELAFTSTNLRTIDIPATVTSIGSRAFSDKSNLTRVTFAENSQLKTIAFGAFQSCTSLKEIILPQTVTWVDGWAFRGCSALTTLHFSDAVKTIDSRTCADCSMLSDLHLPATLETISADAFYGTSTLRHVDFPNTLSTIHHGAFYNCGVDSVLLPLQMQNLGRNAFQNCKNLKYIELPSYLSPGDYSYKVFNDNGSYNYSREYSGYRANFSGCTAVQTVVCPSATPPTVTNTNDLFAGGRSKGYITLRVPSFAVVNYKLDSYWYQFGTIEEGDDIGYWKITSDLALTGNRRMNGKPDIDIISDGRLTVGGNAPMPIGTLNLWQGGQLLSQCSNITADTVNTLHPVSANTWYFFTPSHDVNLAEVSISTGAPYVFRYYDGEHRAQNGPSSKGSWQDVGDGMLHAGQGYIFQTTKDATLTLRSTPEGHAQLFTADDVTTPLAAHDAETSANKGWNYVGNPYPTYFDTYHMGFEAPITVREGNTYKAYRIMDENPVPVLRPGQPFFVQRLDEVDKIVFRKEGRQLTSEPAAHSRGARVASPAARRLFNLTLSDGEQTDQTRVVINPQASLSYELACDAAKFMSGSDSIPMLFTIDAEGNRCAINERPLADGVATLAYQAPQAATLTISATRADGDVWLLDHLTGQSANLLQQDYTFQAEATPQPCATRFTLHFLGGDPTGIDTKAASGRASGAKVFDLQGRPLHTLPQRGITISDGKKTMTK